MPKKTNKKHRTPVYRRPIVWVIVLIGILAVVALFITFYHPNRTQNPDDSNHLTPPSAQSDPGLSSSNQTPDVESDTSTVNEPEDKTVQYEGENPNDSDDLTGVITYKGVDNQTLYINVAIDQFVSGVCKLTLVGKNTSRTVTVSNPAVADIQSSGCQPFEIPTSDLPRDTYSIEIQLSSKDKTGVIRSEVDL